jgi:hypothetical protein
MTTVQAPSSYRSPVPFGTLVRVHARIWRAQRGVVGGSLLAFAAGLLSVVGIVALLPATVTAASVATRFTGFPIVAYSLVWLAVGAVAGAAPFKSGWAMVVLTVAPRRGRWLAACLVSFLLVAGAVTVLFGALSVLLTAIVLAAKGHSPSLVAGMIRPALLTGVLVLIQAGVGFLLGAASRSVTASIIIGYVVAPILPAARIGSVDLGRWLDLNGALTTASSAHPGGQALAAAVTAIVLWVAVPTLIAWSRLRRSVA